MLGCGINCWQLEGTARFPQVCNLGPAYQLAEYGQPMCDAHTYRSESIAPPILSSSGRFCGRRLNLCQSKIRHTPRRSTLLNPDPGAIDDYVT